MLDDGETCGMTLNLNDYEDFGEHSRANAIEVLTEIDCGDVAREFMRLVYDNPAANEKDNEAYEAKQIPE